MREYKFRAWNMNQKIMCFDDEDNSSDYWDGIHSSDLGMINHCLKKNQYSYMQYTGLKDKNEKEIYEGDIMKIPDLYETPENTSTTYHYQPIIYQEYAFCLGEGNPLYKDHDYVSDECEVVGNIYENPELLEVST